MDGSAGNLVPAASGWVVAPGGGPRNGEVVRKDSNDARGGTVDEEFLDTPHLYTPY